MKTKYLFGAAAALMMAACSQDELVSVKQDGIAYGVTASTQTRAADSYCNNRLPESFKVWAKTTDGNLYINGDVIKNVDNVWTDQSGTRYWPEDKTLDFYAHVNGDGVFSFNDGAPTFNGFAVKDDVTEQLDLIYSVEKGQTKPETADKKVILNFRHALSQVCFRARNNMKTMEVEVKGVSVGHLSNTGTFTFPAESTSQNYTHPSHGDEVDPAAPELNGGVWSVEETFSKEYTVTPVGGNVILPAVPAGAGAVKNLTCPEDNHNNGFAQVLTLLPQQVKAWDPTVKAADFNGAYFLVDVVLRNVVKNDAGEDVKTVVYERQAAIPVTVDWKQGYRYIYTFVFDEGGDGGWTPDPDDPKPVLTSIKYDVTVDDFIPVEEDVKMDTGKDGGDTPDVDETTYSLTYDPNGGWTKQDYWTGTHNGDTTVTARSKEAEYVFRTFTDVKNHPIRPGYTLKGWADDKDATAPDYDFNQGITLTKAAPSKTIYAVWEQETNNFAIVFDGNGEGVIGVPVNLSASSTEDSFEFTIPDAVAQGMKYGERVFKGWAETKKTDYSMDDIKFQAGDKVTVTKDSPYKTIYAVWGTPSGAIVAPGAGGEDW